MKELICFDDVQIRPQYSEIESRNDVDTFTFITPSRIIKCPIVAAPMDTVCGVDMIREMNRLGGMGIVHRFYSIEEQSAIIEQSPHPTAIAIGAVGDAKERIKELLGNNIGLIDIILIDTAHGDHIHVKKFMKYLDELKSEYGPFDIIAGSIATADAAKRLIEWGASGLRVGIGGGSMCTTRIKTGIGLPTLSSILEIRNDPNVDRGIPIMADGGIRYPGDVAKALAAGAHSVMIGSLFSGTNEAPGQEFVTGKWPNEKRYKVYRGLASETTKSTHAQTIAYIEGTSKLVENKGPVADIFGDIMDGVRSAFSYVGATTMVEFHKRAQLEHITHASIAEAHPHLLYQ